MRFMRIDAHLMRISKNRRMAIPTTNTSEKQIQTQIKAQIQKQIITQTQIQTQIHSQTESQTRM